VVAIDAERSPSDERAELAGGNAPQQIHLEEPLLRMYETCRKGEIGPGDRRHARHAVGITRDRDLGIEPGELDRAVERRMAEPDRRPQTGGEPDSDEQQ